MMIEQTKISNIYSELSAYIKAINAIGGLLLYRDNEELTFLREWITAKDNANKEEHTALNDVSLSSMVENCAKCGNVNNKKSGWGTGKNDVMIILNTPNNISRIERDELKDESKELLRKMIKAIDIDLEECYVTNLIKCEAVNSINRPGMMFKNCAPILIKEIQEFNPNIVIVMGDDMPIKRIINGYRNRRWFKIDHPISLIKNTELKKHTWAILQNVMTALK